MEGHLKERNYGADWGDYVTFAKHMKHRAGNMGVDLLIVDTGMNIRHMLASSLLTLAIQVTYTMAPV